MIQKPKQEERQEEQNVPHVENRHFPILVSCFRKMDLNIFINGKFDGENGDLRAKK